MAAANSVFLNALGIVCALGTGRRAVAEAVFAEDRPHGVLLSDQFTPGRRLALGAVTDVLASVSDLPDTLRGRNNALLRTCLAQIRPLIDAAIDQHGAHRVAIIVGTSTSGLAASEHAHRHLQQHGQWPPGYHYAQQEMGAPAQFLAHELGTCGPAHVISTACSSSAKALAAGARLLRAGLADVVLAGGADSLCAVTIAGFSALESVSATRCEPFSANRCGINLGEGAALFLMSREAGPVRLAGCGESSDAYHMSAPDPSGHGARSAILQALARAQVAAKAIDYINLHGTATQHNDAMEAQVVADLFGLQTASSSTKPLTGHTLGAAGAIEAAICWMTLVDNPRWRLPPHWWDGAVDPALPTLRLARPGEAFAKLPGLLLSQSFAFGGSNAVLIVGPG
ncbi:MAG: beta-ketoacyl-[acyl-carrier-protein] synthase II [Lysobacterales bacterium CG02_land_8_20_14_3_00_62_12]|nr:MAG: beta-ketoacyl-[acyl-carrier-protein] synthase II [Xanthomonadales bacterium CG02_land_8_20_14_3_00_62_12]